MALAPADALRFLKFVEFTPSGCWLWRGALTTGNRNSPDHGGYGKFTLGNRTMLAHRVSYEAVNGAITQTIDHLCSNRACVNPKHLKDVSMRENILRGNGIMAQHARKTHCLRGHELTGKNLVLVPGGRMCRTCRNASYRAYRQRQRQAVQR